ncbi:DUF2785 domain-containing protein [Streptomyces sp. NPDC044571]|uniref:DUF2785 domain-containing protein n=1 Tax=Streptomyces sp. NPDC044571 TaxID=3155371 RepID=UPI003406A0C7
MITWQAVEDAGYGVPEGHDLDDLVAGLSRALADSDPEVRDGAAYSVLATWIARGVIDAPRRRALGDEMAARFADPRIQARTFAPLVLDMLVEAGEFSPAWVDAFAHWYVAEEDLRGHDDTLGWLHAVAHGADLLAAFGLRPEVDPVRMLGLGAARLLAPTPYVFDQQEDDRLALALAQVLNRPGLTGEQATGWLPPLEEGIRSMGRGPAPVCASNTMRTLRQLYYLADQGVRPHPGADRVPMRHGPVLRQALAAVLDLVDCR